MQVGRLALLAKQVGFAQGDAVAAVAKRFPTTHFAIVDVSNADEGNLDAETGLAAKYRIVGMVETFEQDHQEALCERVVGR